VQLVVVDSRPELEAAELRRFASVLFAEYVARDLSDRLAAARSRLQEARDRAGGGDPASGELVAALDGVLSAIDDLARSDPSLQRRSNRGALALATLRASCKRSRRSERAKSPPKPR
jgi:hypothetical protein